MNSHVAADQYNEWVVKVLKKVIKKTYSNKQFENISRQSAAITGISEVRPCTVVYRERERLIYPGKSTLSAFCVGIDYIETYFLGLIL